MLCLLVDSRVSEPPVDHRARGEDRGMQSVKLAVCYRAISATVKHTTAKIVEFPQ
jgi:hypothetical protein